MALVLQLFTILAIATLTTAQISKSKYAKKYDPADIQTQPSLLTILQSPDSADALPSLPVNLELPREEAADIPFYTPEPGSLTVLKAPAYFANPGAEYNSPYPVPSQELQVPSAEPWNPNNDPKYYYELPAIVTKQELPTNLYPKKYNKEVYEKQKPFAGRPKQEINLVPISEQDYVNKQKNVNKVLLNLAKVQNQKLVESEKVQTMKYDITKRVATADGKGESKEPQTAASGFSHGFDAEGVQQAVAAKSGFNHGLNTELSAPVGLHSAAEGLHVGAGFNSAEGGLHSAGLSLQSTSADLHSADLHSAPAPNKRLEFQMYGHDGPHSYKWGYDTGKGHNRQFRYEERDKHGYVKGHYGYHDKHGKLQVVHYDAHPEEGFHAEGSN